MQRLRRLLAAFKKSEAGTAIGSHSSAAVTGSASENVVDAFEFDPFDSAFIANPYPTLSILRQQYPVYRCSNGSWALSRYDDISAALKDPRLANSPAPYAVVSERNRHKYICADIAQHILPYMDAPAHTHARKIVARSFHQYLNAAPLDLSALCDDLLQAHSGDAIDLLADMATPLCFAVVAQLFGLPADPAAPLQARYKSWSQWFFYLFSIIPSEQILQQTNSELAQCREHFRQLILQRACRPGDDWLSRLLQENHPHGLSETALVDTCMLIMADAINADFGIANALLALAQRSSLQDTLRADPEMNLAAANELLRFDSPTLFIARRALEDIEIGGHTLRKNSGVLLLLASANRDESIFVQADHIDIHRHSNPYLSFGRGEHACIGRQLVVRMVEAVVGALLQRTNTIELLLDEPQWAFRAGHRWLQRLPVKLH